MPRRFKLVRRSDPSGVSGTGLVAHGVQFDDGHVVVRWNSGSPSTSLWNCVTDLLAVHGHQGATVVHWIDPEPGNNTTHPRTQTAQDEAAGRRPAMPRRTAGRHRAR